MGGEARQTALWHHLNGSHRGSSHNGCRRDRARWVGRLPFFSAALRRVRRSDLQRAAARDPQNRPHWFGTVTPVQTVYWLLGIWRAILSCELTNYQWFLLGGIPID